MKEQLLKLMESEGLTPAKFADEISVQRSSISHILSDRNKPSYDFILKVLNRFTGINAEWLMTGKGSMIKGDNAMTKKEMQQDLFNNSKDITGKMKSQPAEPELSFSSGMKSIVKEVENKISEKPGENNRKDVFTNVNNLSFIVAFYQDGTFEKFMPRE
jgi:transcriptional regulator with XRE-family HTH domain